jgi:cysteine desulfurase
MPIYLDHAATTPLRPEALEAMLPFLGEAFGNPSSPHAWGRRARAALDEAHERLAARLGCGPREIVLTSGGTEGLNLAIKGAAWAAKARGHRIVTSTVEHHAVGNTLRYLEKFGFEIAEVPVDRYGRVDPEAVEAAVTDRTTLVVLGLANGEVGTIQPIAEIGRRLLTRAGRECLLVVDAVAAAPYLDLAVDDLGCDLLVIAAHKFEGPKGVGAMYLRKGTHILAQQQGGTQERYRRAGTEDVAGAVGMAVALDLAASERKATRRRLTGLRNELRAALVGLPGVELTGHASDRLPGHLSLVATGAEGSAMVARLDLEGIGVSVGSACTTGSTDPSHVLTAMGFPEDEARGSLRITLGRTTTADEVAAAGPVIARVVGEAMAAGRELAADPLGRVAPA